MLGFLVRLVFGPTRDERRALRRQERSSLADLLPLPAALLLTMALMDRFAPLVSVGLAVGLTVALMAVARGFGRALRTVGFDAEWSGLMARRAKHTLLSFLLLGTLAAVRFGVLGHGATLVSGSGP